MRLLFQLLALPLVVQAQGMDMSSLMFNEDGSFNLGLCFTNDGCAGTDCHMAEDIEQYVECLENLEGMGEMITATTLDDCVANANPYMYGGDPPPMSFQMIYVDSREGGGITDITVNADIIITMTVCLPICDGSLDACPQPDPEPAPEPSPVPDPAPGVDGDPHVKVSLVLLRGNLPCVEVYSRANAAGLIQVHGGINIMLTDCMYFVPNIVRLTQTWGGDYFDYMGQCDLVMLHATDFDGQGHDLDIHIRTKVRYDYSYVEAAVIQIKGQTLEVGSFGDYAVNGVDTPYLGGHAGRLAHYDIYHSSPFTKKHRFDIVLNDEQNITISTFKDLVAVSIGQGPESDSYFQNSVGLMGSYQGKLLARDGETVMDDMNAFGQEWQVNQEEPQLFRSARAPQFPQKCVLPTPKTTQERRLGETIPRQTAEEACSHMSGAAFDNCVHDVMAMGDVDVARAAHL